MILKECPMGFFDRISEGLSRSRDKFKESMNVLLDRGPDLDEEFWEGLEETLILSDVGGGQRHRGEPARPSHP